MDFKWSSRIDSHLKPPPDGADDLQSSLQVAIGDFWQRKQEMLTFLMNDGKNTERVHMSGKLPS